MSQLSDAAGDLKWLAIKLRGIIALEESISYLGNIEEAKNQLEKAVADLAVKKTELEELTSKLNKQTLALEGELIAKEKAAGIRIGQQEKKVISEAQLAAGNITKAATEQAEKLTAGAKADLKELEAAILSKRQVLQGLKSQVATEENKLTQLRQQFEKLVASVK